MVLSVACVYVSFNAVLRMISISVKVAEGPPFLERTVRSISHMCCVFVFYNRFFSFWFRAHDLIMLVPVSVHSFSLDN